MVKQEKVKKDRKKKLKQQIRNFVFNNYRNYILKQLIIWIIFLIIFVCLFPFHFLNASSQLYEKIGLFGLDISFVLIPVTIASSSFRKKFREDRDQLFHLKEKLINLRYEISYKIISEMEEVDNDLLIQLKPFRNPIILNPLIIDGIKLSIRKFNLQRAANASYADIFSFLTRDIRPLNLYQIDLIVVGVIRLLKKYGEKKEYEIFLEGYIETDIYKKLEKGTLDHSFIRKMFYRDLTWPIVYILSEKKLGATPALFLYKKEGSPL